MVEIRKNVIKLCLENAIPKRKLCLPAKSVHQRFPEEQVCEQTLLSFDQLGKFDQKPGQYYKHLKVCRGGSRKFWCGDAALN